MDPKQAAVCAAFEALEHNTQMDLLHREGVYIGKIKLDGESILLYQYQSVYVEVVYSVYRQIVKDVRCFTDTAVLDRYILSSDFDTLEPGI
jgi:hypothetical protein